MGSFLDNTDTNMTYLTELFSLYNVLFEIARTSLYLSNRCNTLLKLNINSIYTVNGGIISVFFIFKGNNYSENITEMLRIYPCGVRNRSV
ncbi:hypothetical protein COBT_002857, partial [Conglomerata obtusa]